ncbi:MAG: ABC transporter permease [Phycisphaerales bacterium JB060]
MKNKPTTSSDVGGVPGPMDDPGKEMRSPDEIASAEELTAVTGVHLMQGIGHRPAEGFWTEAWKQVFKRPGAVLGIFWVGMVAFFAVFAPLVANGHPILLVAEPDANPLGKLLGGLGGAIGSFEGALLILSTVAWSAAWIFAPQRLHPAVRAGLALAPTVVFALAIYAQFYAGQTVPEEEGAAFNSFAHFLLGKPENGVQTSHGFQVIFNLAAAIGLVWAASTFELSRKLRILTTPLIWLIAIGSLTGIAARVGGDAPVVSPMLRFLTVVDLALIIGAVGSMLLLIPKWKGVQGTRGSRAKVLLTVSLQAGLTLLVHSMVSSAASERDAAPWLRAFELKPYFEFFASIGIASVVAVVFLVAHPLNKFTHRAGVTALVGVVMFALMATRWSTPLPDFRYVSQEARGQISAMYTIIPWSPQQGGTAVDLLDPGSNVYSQVLKGLEDVDLSDRSRETDTPVVEMPLDAEVLAAIRANLRFAIDSLPSSPQEAFAAIEEAAAANPELTVADAMELLESRPGPAYMLGTDSKGQDLLSQLLHACRLSISIGLVSTAIAVVIGVTIGALMGYFGGWVDMLLYRVVEIFMAIPLLFLLIVAAAVLPRNTYVMMAIIGCVTWTGSARFIRAEFYKLRGQDFVQSARSVGLPLRSVLFKHMLPNGVTPVLVDASFAIAAAILAEAVLSYLGLGPAGQASWGQLLSDANNQVGKFLWWLAIFPGFAIFLTVLSYNLIGEALRDAIDPKLKKARV